MNSKVHTMNDLVPRFFTSPDTVEGKAHHNKNFSTLYLLRRDVFECFGFIRNNDSYNVDSIKAGRQYLRIHAGTLAIFAGIDLLGKFLVGNDDRQGVGYRFKEFTEEYLNLHGDENEVLYLLRNSLVHSFGLYVPEKKKHIVLHNTRCPKDPPIESKSRNEYVINVMPLHIAFERGAESFRNDVQAYPFLKTRFMRMVNRYGFTHIDFV